MGTLALKGGGKKMAYRFYGKYLSSIAQDPVDDWREAYQSGANDTWDNTSTVTDILAQSSVGGTTYETESVQLNSVINPTTGETLGDKYRKIIHKVYATTDNYLGKMYQFDDDYWLTINTNTRIGAVKTSVVQQCNNTLKWYDSNGVLKQWKCVYSRNLTATSVDYGSEGTPQIEADGKLVIQRNSDTNSITFNQRFILDNVAFQVKQIDNHYSDTLMTIYIFAVPVEIMDENGIANSKNNVTPLTSENLIQPNIVKILNGDTQAYTVYKYVSGVANSNTFTISASGASISDYTLTIVDGNNFTVKNLNETSSILTITCVNNVSAEITTTNIVLGGSW